MSWHKWCYQDSHALSAIVSMQMLKKLSKQLIGENNLNTLSLAIGSISGSMMEEHVFIIPFKNLEKSRYEYCMCRILFLFVLL